MILPTKHVPTSLSIIHIGSTLIGHLDTPKSVSALWERVRKDPGVGNFSTFILSLDFLFIIGAIEFQNRLLIRGAR